MPRIVRVGGIVNLELSPPLDFIEAQHGAFRAHLEDMTGLWERFSRTLASIERERFATSGYGEWPELAESTLRQKTAHGFPPFPLIATGDLYESLTDADRAARMWPDRMTWGTDVPYAIYHQEGATTTRTSTRTVRSGPAVGIRGGALAAVTDESVWHLPQRKVLDIRLQDRRRLETDQVAWLNEVAAETFGRGSL